MTTGSSSGRRPSPGRLDPVVRSLLRGFLSPAVADRIAVALEPVAVADRDAAVTAAAEVLRERFGVSTEAVAAALVRDAGQDVGATALTLGVSAQAVLLAVAAADDAAPAAAAVADGSAADGAAVQEDAPLPAELAAGRATPAERRSDRRSIAIAVGAVAGVIVVGSLIAFSLARAPSDDEVAAPSTRPSVDDGSADPTAPPTTGPTEDVTPSASPSPTASPTDDDGTTDDGGDAEGGDDGAADPVAIDDLRFVTEIDVATGEAGPSVETATTDQDVRAWLALSPAPSTPIIVELTFEGPDGTRTVRPTPVPAGIDVVAVRLPEELGRAPGRYVATASILDDPATPLRVELRLEPAPEA